MLPLPLLALSRDATFLLLGLALVVATRAAPPSYWWISQLLFASYAGFVGTSMWLEHRRGVGRLSQQGRTPILWRLGTGSTTLSSESHSVESGTKPVAVEATTVADEATTVGDEAATVAEARVLLWDPRSWWWRSKTLLRGSARSLSVKNQQTQQVGRRSERRIIECRTFQYYFDPQ